MARETGGSLLERAFTEATLGDADIEQHGDLLDAARELFCHRGIQRTTMDDVARAAGLSRITVYRRVSSKEALVEQVVLRELRRYFDQFLLDIAQAADVEERVVVGFVGSLRAIRGNPLIGVLVRDEPQSVVPLLGTTARPLSVVAGFVAGQLRREQSAGHVAPGVDVDVVAELMVRMSTSFLLTPSDVIDLDDEEQVGAIARRYLVPMLRLPAAD